MKNKALALGGLAIALAAATPSLAHHSFAMFDNDKIVTLTGTVKEFQLANPHAWLHLTVGDKTWALEGGSPNQLMRAGWKRTSVKPGDKVTVNIHPLKDGSAGGSLEKVTLPDGTSVGGR